MINVIVHKEDRATLKKRGYCFLEEKNLIILKNKYYDTLCEIIYDNIMEQFIILTEDAAYYCEHEIIIQPLQDGIIVCMDYRNSKSHILKMKDGKFEKIDHKVIIFNEYL